MKALLFKRSAWLAVWMATDWATSVSFFLLPVAVRKCCWGTSATWVLFFPIFFLPFISFPSLSIQQPPSGDFALLTGAQSVLADECARPSTSTVDSLEIKDIKNRFGITG